MSTPAPGARDRDAPPRGSPGSRGLGGAPTSLAEAVGGPRGVIESVAPSLVFLVAVTATAPLALAGGLAVAVAVVLIIARSVAHLPVGPAVTGALLVGVCALAAVRSGRATGFYSVGLLLNVVYAVVLAASTLPLPARGRFTGGAVPLIGVVVAAARPGAGRPWAWRSNPTQRRLMVKLTWLWVALFVVRLAVEVPLYEADAVTALGVARLALGLPPFALLVWLTWLAVRSSPSSASDPAGSAPEGQPAPPRSPTP